MSFWVLCFSYQKSFIQVCLPQRRGYWIGIFLCDPCFEHHHSKWCRDPWKTMPKTKISFSFSLLFDSFDWCSAQFHILINIFKWSMLGRERSWFIHFWRCPKGKDIFWRILLPKLNIYTYISGLYLKQSGGHCIWLHAWAWSALSGEPSLVYTISPSTRFVMKQHYPLPFNYAYTSWK